MSDNTQQKNLSVFHLTSGDVGGYELVWLHGWGQTHKSLLRLSSLFHKLTSNRLFDLPGFGASKRLHVGASTKDYANWLALELGPKTKPRILIGHSFGGRVSIQMGAHYKEAIDGIILISSAGLKKKRGVGWKFRSNYLKFIGQLAKLCDVIFKTKYREVYSNRFGSEDYKNAGLLKGTLISAVNEHLSIEAKSIVCPTLLIYGEDDTETPPEVGRMYKNLIKGSELKILKGFDHLNILSHGANQCQSLITRFLERIKTDD